MAETKALVSWYKKNYRDFPWRKTKDPYRIWISEVMLQQTRAIAVVDYYQNFLKLFPNLKALAEAKEADVLAAWSGLGYYSRARNLHQAAQVLVGKRFPKTHEELMQIPSFGPYTARAVASFAFSDACAVLDGNVIRFLSRYYSYGAKWWQTAERQKLQAMADTWVKSHDSAIVNQALIEIGATICSATKPSCLICPVRETCKARADTTVHKLPLRKAKKEKEIWIIDFDVCIRRQSVALSRQHNLPFLKGHYLYPLEAKKTNVKPEDYIFSHAITHYKIYVKSIKTPNQTRKAPQNTLEWFLNKEVKKVSPFSLTTKVMDYVKNHT